MIPEKGLIEEGESGAWVADLEFPSEPDGTITLGSEVWSGAILSSRQEGARWVARIVGGRGGLTKSVRDRQYQGTVSVTKIFASILSQAGETQGISVSDRTENYFLEEETAGQALDSLARHLSASWRVLRDGSVTLYRPANGSVVDEKKALRVGADPCGEVFFSVPDSSLVRVGQTYQGTRIRSIRWCVSPKQIVAEISFGQDLLTDLSGLDLLKTYSGKVDKQNSDGTLDLIVSGKFGLSKVPLLGGIPGSKVTMNPGEAVTVGFLKGDSRSPYAMGAGQDRASTAGIAREGDTVDCGTLVVPTTLAGVLGPISFQIQYVPPGPSHTSQVAAAVLAMASFVPTTLDLAGVITSGYARLKLPRP